MTDDERLMDAKMQTALAIEERDQARRELARAREDIERLTADLAALRDAWGPRG